VTHPDQHSFSARLRWLMGSPIGAALGALAYGLWAVYANRDAGMPLALRAGAAHWLTSALLTYFGAASMRVVFDFVATTFTGTARVIATCIGGLLFTYVTLVSVHLLNGSPHILLTLAPGMIPTLLFCITYAALLQRGAPVPAQAGALTGSP
jgi:hypothetical protein